MILTSIVNPDLALSLVKNLANNDNIKNISLDTETNGEDIRDGRGKLIGISMAWRDTDGMNAIYLPFFHRTGGNYEFKLFIPHLQRILDTKHIALFNAKFDLVSVMTVGLDSSKTRYICLMLLSHLLDENKPKARNLNEVSKLYLGKPGKKSNQTMDSIIDTLGWDWVPPKWMVEYAVTDAVTTLELAEALKPLAAREDLREVWHHKEAYNRIVMNMEIAGIKIDTDLAEKEISRGEGIMLDVVQQLGNRSPGVRKHLQELLLDELKLPPIFLKDKKTGEERLTFNKDAMLRYDGILAKIDNPTARLILKYRGWEKTISSNYKPYINLLSPDGRLRCNYKLHGTVTGRMSCEEPNLQQIPRESTNDWNGNLKKVFIPKEGYSLIGVDYSQLELRLGALYAKEPHLIEVFREGRDVFTEMAQRIGLSRQNTKTLVYTIQYGGGVNRLSDVFGLSKQESKQRIDTYYGTYPNFRKASKAVSERARLTGNVPIWSGRFRHFENPESEYYKAFNSMIQGGAADILEHAMVNLDREGYNNNDCRMLLAVHDEVIFEVRNDIKEEAAKGIVNTMTNMDKIFNEPSEVVFAAEAGEWGSK